MTTITSDTVTVKNDIQSVFSYLLDLNNFKDLLPQDKISDWESSATHCSFRIQSAVTIPLVYVSDESPNKIHIKSGDKAPFPFTLDINLEKVDEQTCSGNMVFKGEMNMFIKLMAEKPLTNLFNFIANKLVEVKSKA